MKFMLRFIVAMLIIGFAVGAFAAWRGWLPSDYYIVATGIVGSVASIIGLIALISPRLTSSDVRTVDAELLQQLSNTARAVKDLEERASVSRLEADTLAQKRAEIELLVRQASIKAFLEERLRALISEINTRVETDATLSRFLNDYVNVRSQVTNLQADLDKSDQAELILSILHEADSRSLRQQHESYIIHVFGSDIDIAPILKASKILGQHVTESIAKLLR